jgi:predicted metal-dependent phosphotriesterase family hydrolase
MARVSVMTVLGPVSPDSLGVTLMHEHLLIDVSYKWQQPVEASRRGLAEERITLRNLGYLRRNIGAVRDNLRLLDVDLAAAEAREFKKEGGGTIVDVTTIGIGRDPRALRAISALSGVHIVICCGYYLARSHPPSVAALASWQTPLPSACVTAARASSWSPGPTRSTSIQPASGKVMRMSSANGWRLCWPATSAPEP